jgi:hypothetical protein
MKELVYLHAPSRAAQTSLLLDNRWSSLLLRYASKFAYIAAAQELS